MNDRPAIRGLLVALAIAIGIIVAMAVTMMSRLTGQPMPSAVMKGGAAFAGTVALVFLILANLGLT